jgi:ABC-type transport system involved in multi-copper enzyme maturation permease subunit
MVRTIAAKEMLDQVSSPKFVFLFVVSTVLIVFSLYTGSSAYTSARSEYQATEALSRRELENRKSYFEISQFGVKVARAPGPLSAIAGGVSSALGRSARVRPEQQPEFAPPPLADTPVLAVLGELDFNVVVKILLSLFVLLLTYNAIAGEKENGTLKAVLANPVPRTRLLLGKMLGLFGVFLMATAAPAVVGILIMKVGFGIELAGADWLRLAGIALAAGLYLLALFAIGMLVSTTTSRSAVAFLVLLLVWVAFVEVIPKASPMIAGQVRPAPSYASLQSERDRLQGEFQRSMFQVMSSAFAHAGMGPGGGPSTPEEDARRQANLDSAMGRGRDSLQQDLNAKLASVDESYRNRQDAMTRLALFLSRFSPAAAMSHAVETMAGTDFEMHRRWRDDLINYRGGLETFLKAKGVTFGGFRMVVRSTTSTTTGGGTRSNEVRFGGPDNEGSLDLSAMPKFTTRPESMAAALGRAAPDLAIMALWSAGALLLAFWKFLRYDVR